MPPKQPPNHSERRSESTAVHQTGAAEGVTALRRRYESHHATKALVTPEPTHRKAYGRATPQVEASPEQGKGSSQNPMYRGPNTVARGGTGTFEDAKRVAAPAPKLGDDAINAYAKNSLQATVKTSVEEVRREKASEAIRQGAAEPVVDLTDIHASGANEQKRAKSQGIILNPHSPEHEKIEHRNARLREMYAGGPKAKDSEPQGVDQFVHLDNSPIPEKPINEGETFFHTTTAQPSLGRMQSGLRTDVAQKTGRSGEDVFYTGSNSMVSYAEIEQSGFKANSQVTMQAQRDAKRADAGAMGSDFHGHLAHATSKELRKKGYDAVSVPTHAGGHREKDAAHPNTVFLQGRSVNRILGTGGAHVPAASGANPGGLHVKTQYKQTVDSGRQSLKEAVLARRPTPPGRGRS